MQINPRNGRFYAVFRGFLHPAGVCRARRAAAVVGRSWASWARKRTPTAADAHNLKIVVKLRAVPASKVPFPVGIAGFPDFSRPVPVYPAFLKYVVPVQRPARRFPPCFTASLRRLSRCRWTDSPEIIEKETDSPLKVRANSPHPFFYQSVDVYIKSMLCYL